MRFSEKVALVAGAQVALADLKERPGGIAGGPGPGAGPGAGLGTDYQGDVLAAESSLSEARVPGERG